MGTPSFSPCLRGSKKKDGLIEPSTHDPNQLLGRTEKACFPQIQYSPWVPPVCVCSKIVPSFPEIREAGQWVGVGFCVVWSSSPLGLLGSVVIKPCPRQVKSPTGVENWPFEQEIQ
jgi:hypothetical protein